MPRQAQHFKQTRGMTVNITKDNLSLCLLGSVDYTHQVRHTDAVNQFGIAKINYDRAAARLELFSTLALDAFTAQFVQVIAGVDDRGVADTARLHRSCPRGICHLSKPPSYCHA